MERPFFVVKRLLVRLVLTVVIVMDFMYSGLKNVMNFDDLIPFVFDSPISTAKDLMVYFKSIHDRVRRDETVFFFLVEQCRKSNSVLKNIKYC